MSPSKLAVSNNSEKLHKKLTKIPGKGFPYNIRTGFQDCFFPCSDVLFSSRLAVEVVYKL